MAGDVEQVSLVHILSPAQPGSSHAATIEVMGKAALDDLGAQLESLAGDPGLEPRTVVGDRAPRRLITVPARKAGLLVNRLSILTPDLECAPMSGQDHSAALTACRAC